MPGIDPSIFTSIHPNKAKTLVEQSTMSSIVAVAGGSGGLGRAIIDALKASSKYEPLILSRKVRSKCCLHSSNLNFLVVG